jgi:hypothetical protein
MIVVMLQLESKLDIADNKYTYRCIRSETFFKLDPTPQITDGKCYFFLLVG